MSIRHSSAQTWTATFWAAVPNWFDVDPSEFEREDMSEDEVALRMKKFLIIWRLVLTMKVGPYYTVFIFTISQLI